MVRREDQDADSIHRDVNSREPEFDNVVKQPSQPVRARHTGSIVRRYFESSIELYRYNRVRADIASALDYFEVWLSFEVYSMLVELGMALRRVEEEGEMMGR